MFTYLFITKYIVSFFSCIIVPNALRDIFMPGKPLFPDDAKMWKSRIVAGGNRLRDARGQQVKEKTVHEVPVSFGETRASQFPAQAQPNGVTKRGDVRGAYTTAPLGGTKVYARIPKRHQPTWY